MRFYLRWPTTPPDCGYWSRQPDTDDLDGSEGVIDSYSVRVVGVPGQSAHDLYRRTVDRLWSYDIFPPDLMRSTLCSDDVLVREGVVIVQRVKVGFVVMEAAVRVVRVWHDGSIDAEESGFTYATVRGHPEMGVSSFWVSRSGEVVEFHIEARSQPGTLLTRLGSPVSRAFQRAATRAALRHVIAA